MNKYFVCYDNSKGQKGNAILIEEKEVSDSTVKEWIELLEDKAGLGVVITFFAKLVEDD